MKSIQFSQYGSPDLLRFVEVEKPVPKYNEVLIKIHAVSINSWDWELLNGKPFVNKLMFGLKRPTRLKTLGFDVAGIVEAVGDKVTRFKVGDAVYGDLSGHQFGGFAEYVAAPEGALTLKPAEITFEQAAAVPQAALMSWQGLVDLAQIKQGQQVLIHGASGGSGTIALQIAKLYGAETTAVCRGEKMEFVRTLGADHVIDYGKQDFTRNGKQYDVILDAHANHSLRAFRRALKPGGVYIMHGGESSAITKIMLLGWLVSLFSSRKIRVLMLKANKGLDKLNALMIGGKLKPVIDKVYPFDQTIEALKYYGAGKARGKVVISMERG